MTQPANPDAAPSESILKNLQDNAPILTIGVAAITALLSFAAWLFECGKALAFNIPLEEVPLTQSLNVIILNICIAIVVLAINIWSYKQITHASGVGKTLIAILKIILLVLAGYAIFCVAFAIVTSVALQAPLNLDTPGDLLFMLFVLFLLLLIMLSSIGIVFGIAEKANSLSQKTKGDSTSTNENGDTLDKSAAPTKKTHHKTKWGPIALIAGICVIVLGAAMITGGSIMALQGDTIRYGSLLDKEAEYALILSDGNNYCAQQTSETSDGTWAINTNDFRWIAKENLVIKTDSRTPRPLFLFPDYNDLFSQENTCDQQ